MSGFAGLYFSYVSIFKNLRSYPQYCINGRLSTRNIPTHPFALQKCQLEYPTFINTIAMEERGIGNKGIQIARAFFTRYFTDFTNK
jgi:hypothetical protein